MNTRKVKSDDVFIKIEKVAQRLGVSIEVIKKLIVGGKLLALKLEEKILISQKSFENFITKSAKEAMTDLREEIDDGNQSIKCITSEEIISILKEFVPTNCNITLESMQGIVYEHGMSRGLLNKNDVQMEPGTSNVRYKHLLNAVLQRLRYPNNRYSLTVSRIGRGLYKFK